MTIQSESCHLLHLTFGGWLDVVQHSYLCTQTVGFLCCSETTRTT
jgi:hypothetical protein